MWGQQGGPSSGLLPALAAATLQALGKPHPSAFSSSSGKQMQLSPVAGKADWGYLFEALSGGCGGRGAEVWRIAARIR